jgi:hypothetical protein
MKLAHYMVVGSFLLLVSCSSSPSSKRQMASVSPVPAECALPSASVIQRAESTVTSDSTLLSAQVTCHQGVVAVSTFHPNGRSMVFTLPPSGQPGTAVSLVVNERGETTQRQIITFPASSNVANQNRLRLAFNTFSIDYRFDLANLNRLRESCTRIHKPLTVGGVAASNEICQMNLKSTGDILL